MFEPVDAGGKGALVAADLIGLAGPPAGFERRDMAGQIGADRVEGGRQLVDRVGGSRLPGRIVGRCGLDPLGGVRQSAHDVAIVVASEGISRELGEPRMRSGVVRAMPRLGRCTLTASGDQQTTGDQEDDAKTPHGGGSLTKPVLIDPVLINPVGIPTKQLHRSCRLHRALLVCPMTSRQRAVAWTLSPKVPSAFCCART